MRPFVLVAAAAALLYAGATTAQEAPTSKSKTGRDVGDAASAPVGATSAATLGSVSTSAFVQNAARSDMYEIQAGNLALQKSQNAQIKAFAQKMVHDHTMTSQAMMAALPSGVHAPTGLDKRRQGLLDDLKNSAPGEFDKRYAMQQTKAHEEALTLMRGYAAHGGNAKLKQLASQTVPMIEMHLQMAKMLPGAGA